MKGYGRILFFCTLACALVTFFVLAPARQNRLRAQTTRVDMLLVLAIDVSYSVDATEFALQMDGMALAFRDPAVHRAIKSGRYGRIGVSVTQWSSEKRQVVGVPWTILDTPESAIAFANRLAREPRRVDEGGTATGAAMRHAGALLLSAPFNTLRRVIDVSSDGRSNRGVLPDQVRDVLAARNITINGLVIKNEWPTLDKYFEKFIIGGPYHFVISADNYQAYKDAIRRKLLKEIAGPGIT